MLIQNKNPFIQIRQDGINTPSNFNLRNNSKLNHTQNYKEYTNNISFNGYQSDRFRKTSFYESMDMEPPETILDYLRRTKTQLWLSIPPPTKLSLKAFFNDKPAFTFEAERPLFGKVTHKETLAKINLSKRNEPGTDKAKLRKVEFDDDSTVYVIQKGCDKLGFIDIDKLDDDKIHVDYATTIVGREKYRNLFQILMQAVIEDYIIQNNTVPSIEAEALPVGNMSFSREKLYKLYGADVVKRKEDMFVLSYIVLSKDKVKKMLKQISESKTMNFVLPNFPKAYEFIK